MQGNKKQYGLIRLSKGNASNSLPVTKKPSIFDDSDESDSDVASVPPQFQSSKNVRKQAEVKISQAIEEDPSIFQYDEVYDDMKHKDTNSASTKVSVEKKPRYISTMIKNRENREKEQELRSERKIQKEREAEGNEFQDKETYVTTAYKEKLEEMRKAREEIEQQEREENFLDVTKQGDLNGFYRSLWKNNLSNPNEHAPDETAKEEQSIKFNKKSTNSKKLNLRERNITNEEENDEAENIVVIDKTYVPLEQPQCSSKQKPLSTAQTEMSKSEAESPPLEMSSKSGANKRPLDEKKEKDTPKESTEIANLTEVLHPEEEPVKKPKIDRAELIRRLFTKRTVGQGFEDAKCRYLERKALRQMAA